MIQELNRFETIRYPDEIIDKGACIGFGFNRGRVIHSVTFAHPIPLWLTGRACFPAGSCEGRLPRGPRAELSKNGRA
jgi:hypothetical protein